MVTKPLLCLHRPYHAGFHQGMRFCHCQWVAEYLCCTPCFIPQEANPPTRPTTKRNSLSNQVRFTLYNGRMRLIPKAALGSHNLPINIRANTADKVQWEEVIRGSGKSDKLALLLVGASWQQRSQILCSDQVRTSWICPLQPTQGSSLTFT